MTTDKEIHDMERNPVHIVSATEAKNRSQVELARAAFGMWANRQDIDDEWLERGRQQWRSKWPDA